ncbi:MAG: Ig-like domain-containing protein, partial [Mycobacterium sp.]
GDGAGGGALGVGGGVGGGVLPGGGRGRVGEGAGGRIEAHRTLTGNPAKGAVILDAATGAFTYTPTPAARHNAAADTATDAERTDTITVTVNDGHGGTISVPISLSVLAANQAPTAAPATAPATVKAVAAAGEIEWAVIMGYDAQAGRYPVLIDAREFIGSDVAPNNVGSLELFDLWNGPITFDSYDPENWAKYHIYTDTPLNFAGSAFSRYLRSGGGFYGVAAEFSFANPAAIGTVTGTLGVTDADGDTLAYSLTGDPAKGSVVLNDDGTFTYTPDPAARHTAAADTATDTQRTDTITITVTDGHGGTASRQVSVTINPANRPPALSQPSLSAANPSNGAVAGTWRSTDPDGDPLTYTVANAPTSGSVVLNASGFAYTPSYSARLRANSGAFNDSFNVTINDGYGGRVTQSIAVPVSPLTPNRAPTATVSNVVTRTVADGLGSNLITNYGNSICVDGNTVYVATTGGLGISANGGRTFTNRTTANGLPNDYSFAIAATGGAIFAGTNSYSGLSTSRDGGATFTNRTGTGLGSVVYSAYTNGGKVYVGSNQGLSISSDGGNTFTLRSLGGYGLGIHVDGNNVYAATTSGLSVSTDGGDTFTRRLAANDLRGGVYASGNNIYAARQSGLAVSTDGGNTFNTRTIANGLGSNIVLGVCGDGNTVYAATSGGLGVSTDGGNTFTNYGRAIGFASDAMYGVKVSGGKVYVANGGGLGIWDRTGRTGRVIGTDPDRDTLTYTVGTPSTNGTVVLAVDGSYVYTPNGAGGSDSFTVVVSDGKGGSVVVPVNITA